MALYYQLCVTVCLTLMNYRPRTAVAGFVGGHCSVPGLIFAIIIFPGLSFLGLTFPDKHADVKPVSFHFPDLFKITKPCTFEVSLQNNNRLVIGQ